MKTLKLFISTVLMLSFILTSCQKEEIVMEEMTQIETTTSQAGKQQLQLLMMRPDVIVGYSTGCCWESIYTVEDPSQYLSTNGTHFELWIDGVLEEDNNTSGIFSFNFSSAGSHTYQVIIKNANDQQTSASAIKTANHYASGGSPVLCFC